MKIYCLDTSVLIDNPSVVTDLGESEIIIPFCVLNEIDGHRKKPGVLGRNARQAIRNINAIVGDQDITKGVETEAGGILRFLRADFERETIDLKIIACAEWIKAHEGEDPTLLSNDIGLRILAKTKGIKSEEHKSTGPNSFVYTGMGEITLPESLITQLHERGYVHLQEHCSMEDDDFYQNQMLIIKSDEKNSSTLARFERYEDQSAFVKVTKIRPWDVAPANIEQTFAMDLLMNPEIDLVTLVGKAGTGKTFLATAAGLDQVFDLGLYERIVLLRPIVEVGQGIGFLPGTEEEKLEPWIRPFKDNLMVLFNQDKKTIDMHFEKRRIVVEAMSYIRGRSIPNSFIIVDEAQNLTIEELKTILTRAAHGSKIVLTGDIEQIDIPKLDAETNGLSRVIEAFKDEAIAGHITMTKGQRSALATVSAEIL